MLSVASIHASSPDDTLEHLPEPCQIGKTKVGGIDLNKPRMRWVSEAVMALSVSPRGFTASQLAIQVPKLSKQSATEYGPLRAAYDLKKLRGKDIVRRIGGTRRYDVIPTGLRAITALVVLRTKTIKPLLAAAQSLRPSRKARNPRPLDRHYEDLRAAMQGVFERKKSQASCCLRWHRIEITCDFRSSAQRAGSPEIGI